MPDKTKLQVFKDRGVTIAKICTTCRHSNFVARKGMAADWGECGVALYQHEKHTGVRPMPINAAFTCPSHSFPEDGYPSGLEYRLALGEYANLVPKE